MTFDVSVRRALLERHANDWLRVGVENLHREYPHRPNLFIAAPGPYRTHRERHPVFFGAYDWHSCVEMYWTMVRIMRLAPGLPSEAEARGTINSLLTAEGMARELATFADPAAGGMERPYGGAGTSRLSMSWRPGMTPMPAAGCRSPGRSRTSSRRAS
jgi:Protein of unknown function (DUF2891)